jgi:hypothetical protein
VHAVAAATNNVERVSDPCRTRKQSRGPAGLAEPPPPSACCHR